MIAGLSKNKAAVPLEGTAALVLVGEGSPAGPGQAAILRMGKPHRYPRYVVATFIYTCISNVLFETQKKRAVVEEGAEQGRFSWRVRAC